MKHQKRVRENLCILQNTVDNCPFKGTKNQNRFASSPPSFTNVDSKTKMFPLPDKNYRTVDVEHTLDQITPAYMHQTKNHIPPETTPANRNFKIDKACDLPISNRTSSVVKKTLIKF